MFSQVHCKIKKSMSQNKDHVGWNETQPSYPLFCIVIIFVSEVTPVSLSELPTACAF